MNHNPEAVAGLKPEYLGFIFWKPSPRAFEGTRLPDLPKAVIPVGVFVDAPLEDLLEKVGRFRLEGVQLHGTETPAFCRDLRQALQKQSPDTVVIKAFSVGTSFSFGALEPYQEACDYFLFDTRGPLPGGNGKAFDWNLLSGYPFEKPFFLSGGIGEADCEKLRTFLKRPQSRYCHAIDVNSKFETRPGEKDIDALRRFLDCPIWRDHGHNFKPNQNE